MRYYRGCVYFYYNIDLIINKITKKRWHKYDYVKQTNTNISLLNPIDILHYS